MDQRTTSDGEVTRRTLLAGAAAGGVVAAAPTTAAAQRRTVGIGRGGRNAVEVIGTIVQDGLDLTGYGYLTRIAGLRASQLFSGGGLDRTEANARFTFYSEVRMVARSVRPELFSVVGTGSLAFYRDDAGADFDAPKSFRRGARVATYDARFENVLTVVAPDQAVTTITGELEQRSARAFGRYRLGRRGLRMRLHATGPGRRTDAQVPRAVFHVAGHLV